MARHGQTGQTMGFLCEACRRNKCPQCIDKARKKLVDHGHLEPGPNLCECRKRDHNAASPTS